MHPNVYLKLLGGVMLALGLGMMAVQAQQPPVPQPAPSNQPPAPTPKPPTAQVDPKTGALIVPLGGVVSFKPDTGKDAFSDVVVSREDVVQVRVSATDPRELLLTGRTTGQSQLTLVFKDRPPLVFDVVVQPDLTLLRNLIRRTVPTANVEVTAGLGNSIILSGYVTSPQDAEIIMQLAANAAGQLPGQAAGQAGQPNIINAMQIGGGQQVQIDVVVASVDRNLLRQRGFDFAVSGSTVQVSSLVSGLIGVQQQQQLNIPGLVRGVSPTANLQLGITPATFIAGLQALRNEGVAKFIAEPRIVTQSGRPAFFRAGGQQAVVSPQAGLVGPGAQLQPFGTELEVLPIVYGNGMIWLEIQPRISAVNFGLGIIINGQATPGFTEQSVRTAVMLESGQTYAIGGLIQNSVEATNSKVPVLGDLPFIGVGFSRLRHEVREQELIILVTPRLVGPLNCDQVPKRVPGRETREPDDYELFLENILEAPRGQRKVWSGRCYNAAYKCDPTAAIFPCVGDVCTGQGNGGGMFQLLPAGTGKSPMSAPASLPPLTSPSTAPASS
ncbi:MAG: pilus assembly protein N-terminal domain-containing protein, partial [Gemmataceae bacterium]|nr:pilus assembly protein N-terminal domain-containing protein [Gemmataceae bacterium]